MAFADAEYLPDHAEVNNLFVMTQYRGQGLGKALLQIAADRIRQQNLSTTGLFSGYNLPALNFYTHLGFRKVYFCWVKNLK